VVEAAAELVQKEVPGNCKDVRIEGCRIFYVFPVLPDADKNLLNNIINALLKLQKGFGEIK
jgi:hypothetical protein